MTSPRICERVNILGVGLSVINRRSAVRLFFQALEQKQFGYITVTGVHGVMEAHRDQDFAKVLNQLHLITPDGQPVRWALNLLGAGFFSFGEVDRYRTIVDQLRHHDPYLVCADFAGYVAAEAQAAAAYRDRVDWSRRALRNIIGARKFSSDATVRQYAREIWGISPVKISRP